MNTQIERILPILVYIQANLDQDLSLEKLAAQVHLSPYHFHRLFRATIGETAKQYVQRLRLEQAAFRLKIQDQPVIDLAFELGYQSHESFTRAFRRQFDVAPKTYKQARKIDFSTLDEPIGRLPTLNQHATNHAISKVRIHQLEPLTVAFIRQLGDYEAVATNVYDRLIEWAIANGLYAGDNLLLGVGHDDPTITPTEKVRFDACLQVQQPFPPSGEIGCQTLAGGLHATATYVGPYGPDLYQAHAAIFTQLHNHPDYTIVGLPAIEVYHTTRINPSYALNHTQIYIPIMEKG